MEKGKIIQISGPVVDVQFEKGPLPHIKEALTVENQGKKCVMEVAKQLGNYVIRCIMLSASEGLCRDMEVTPTGAGITVPVGEKTLGRLFNVLGEAIDGGDAVRTVKNGVSTENRQPSRNRVLWLKYWRPGSRSSICLLPMQRAARSDCLAVPV